MHSSLGEGPTYYKHILALSGQVGGGGRGSNKRCGQKIHQKNMIYIYQDLMF